MQTNTAAASAAAIGKQDAGVASAASRPLPGDLRTGDAPPWFSRGKLLAGLIGAGIARSLTPALQEEEARRQGLRLHYQLIDLERSGAGVGALAPLLDAARMMGFAGLNITYPCKQAVVPLLDDLSEEARAIGAVNTVVIRDGKLLGGNTDCSGWRWGFERALPRADLSVVVLLGAGGAGSAVAHALMQMSAGRLLIHDTAPHRARALAESLARRHGDRRAACADDLAGAMAQATGLVHASPTGMAALPGLPLPARLLRPDIWVADVVYVPLETGLLKAARALGCATVDGGTMAVGQAMGAFECFTGLPADAERMTSHFGRLLEVT